MLLLAAAVAAWLVISVLGGFALGRLLELATRRRRSAWP
jgi:hypothetical protein